VAAEGKEDIRLQLAAQLAEAQCGQKACQAPDRGRHGKPQRDVESGRRILAPVEDRALVHPDDQEYGDDRQKRQRQRSGDPVEVVACQAPVPQPQAGREEQHQGRPLQQKERFAEEREEKQRARRRQRRPPQACQ